MSRETMSPLRDAVRTFNKHVLNPLMVRAAGRKHWYAAAIRHTGRRSGRVYTTPVVADRVDGAFVVPLPYGTAVDWLRNTQAAGSATISVGGRSFAVSGPRIIDASEAADYLSARRHRMFRRFGVHDFAVFTPAAADDVRGGAPRSPAPGPSRRPPR